jgi:hypothetical protein
MAHESQKIIKVTANSELGKLVDEARHHPVLLEKDGAVYSLTPRSSDPDDLWAGYVLPTSRKPLPPMAAVGKTQTLMR